MLIQFTKNTLKIFFLISVSLKSLLAQDIYFKHLNVENGLSNNKVNCILEDRFGFIWFGTEDGLNRFDGYDLKIYRHQPDDKNSISSNDIWALFEDKDGFIWIGTKGGEINKYNPKLDKFESWEVGSKNTTEKSITCIFKDSKENLWIGTYRNGLYLFDISNKKFSNWKYHPEKANSISNNYITSILEDDKGNLWISTYNGLNKFNPAVSKNTFLRYYNNPQDISTISNNLIWNLIPSKIDRSKFWIGTAKGIDIYDSDNSLFTRLNIPFEKTLQFGSSVASIIEENTEYGVYYWLGTYAGLVRTNSKGNSFTRYLHEENNSLSLINNQINTLIKDRSGVIWIATENGISYISPKEVRFNQYLAEKKLNSEFNKLRKTSIIAISQSKDGTVWLGTAKGLFSVQKLEDIKASDAKSVNTGINVWSLYNGNSNNIWIGTYGQGLKEYVINTNSLKSIPIKSKILMPSPFLYIKSVLQDKDDFVWAGCWGSGLVRLDPGKEEYEIFINDENNPNSLSYNDVWAIYEDSKNNIWIATNGGGLNLFNKKQQLFYRIYSNPKDSSGLSSNSVYSICESKYSANKNNNNEIILWIGTSNGLNKVVINNSDLLNEKKQLRAKVKYYSVRNGLSDNSVKSIVEDKNGNLWLGTSNGLSEFDPVTEKFSNYSIADGLDGNSFNFGSSLRTDKGSILIGSTNGLDIFKPNEIVKSEFKAPIYITDFQLFNESVASGDDSPLKVNVIQANEITLSYDQNIFSFRFSALDYNSPGSIQYAYKMEGFDKDWVYSGKRRYAAYTNLDPGTYTFLVKSTNSDGIWNDNARSIKVIINQPWWRTGWAYFIYVVIIGVGLYFIRKTEVNRTKLRNELRIREIEADKLREIEKIKSRFFTNLSHEFRTPLMLIKGPVEQLLRGNKVNQAEQIKLIQRNSDKLQNLIDQLLELSQLEASSIELKAKKENLITIVRGIFFSFSELAERKKISLKFNSVKDEILTWIDKDKFEKILNNLLSNAFKFTPENGKISIEVINTTIDYIDYTTVTIKDSGIGIPEDKVDKIFDRFFQVDDSSKRAYSGSGIGLSLVKELVDLHKWKIFVYSKEGSGTEFILQIPLDENYLSDYQKVYDVTNTNEGLINAKSTDIDNENHNQTQENGIIDENAKTGNSNKATLLIVEDSEDVRIYLQDILKEDYDLMISENGEEGLDAAIEKLPDLIISDVMMPIMDGIEFCKRIKSNWQTAHIPVILLTAKASTESKIEGLETGADDYVIKPFSFRELSVRIKNLLEQRKILKQKFSKSISIPISDNHLSKADQEFLDKTLQIVEKNLSNIEFDSEQFAKEIFLSRSQLHRKIQSITGQSTGEYIRTIRLKKAAALILEKKLSVTQIAFEVGFNSPSHFSKAFKQMFDCLPSEFINRSNS